MESQSDTGGEEGFTLRRSLDIQFALVAGAVICTPFWVDTRPIKELVFLLSTLVILYMVFRRDIGTIRVSFRKASLDAPLVLLCVWMVVSLLWAWHRYMAAGPVMVFFSAVSMFFVTRSAKMLLADLQQRCFVFSAIIGAIAVLGLLQGVQLGASYSAVFRLYPYFTGRISSTAGNPNILANLLNMGLFVCVGAALSGVNRKQKILAVSVVAVILPAMALARSKGAVLGLLAGIAVFQFLWAKWGLGNHRRVLPVMGLWLGAAAVAAVVVRLRTGSSLTSFLQDPARVSIWRGCWDMTRGYLFQGHGVGQFATAFSQYQVSRTGFSRIVESAHSEPLELLLELGVIGLALAAWVVGAFVYSLLAVKGTQDGEARSRLTIVAGLAAAIVATLVQSIVSSNMRWVQILQPLSYMSALVLAGAAPYGNGSRLRSGQMSVRTVSLLKTLGTFAFAFAMTASIVMGGRVLLSTVLNHEARVCADASRSSPEWEHVLQQEALRYCEDSVALNPCNYNSWYMLGVLRFSQGDRAMAASAFEKVDLLYPKYAQTSRYLEATRGKIFP